MSCKPILHAPPLDGSAWPLSSWLHDPEADARRNYLNPGWNLTGFKHSSHSLRLGLKEAGRYFYIPALGDFLYHGHIYFRNSDRTPIPRSIAAFNLNNASIISWWYHYQNDFPTPRSFAIPNRIHGSAHLPSCTKHYHHRRHVFHNKCRGYSGELLVDHNRT